LAKTLETKQIVLDQQYQSAQQEEVRKIFLSVIIMLLLAQSNFAAAQLTPNIIWTASINTDALNREPRDIFFWLVTTPSSFSVHLAWITPVLKKESRGQTQTAFCLNRF
jgi:hypothetical protein